jgi:hypothetical protein
MDNMNQLDMSYVYSDGVAWLCDEHYVYGDANIPLQLMQSMITGHCGCVIRIQTDK